MPLIPNLPTPEGAELGKHLARYADQEEARQAPEKSRCGTCAFRLGTVPNQSAVTLMDALKCALEGEPFLCHEDGKSCRGWMLLKKPSPIEVPWEYSA